MAYAYRVKFAASLAANGDITPGAAKFGFKTDPLSSGIPTVLIENTATGAWQICTYDTGATSGARRTVVEESAGAPFASLPMTGLTATFIAPTAAYVDVTPGINMSVGEGAVMVGTDNIVLGYLSRSEGSNGVVIGHGAVSDALDNILIGNDALADNYSYGAGNGNIAIGHNIHAGGAQGIAIGHSTFVGGSGCIIIGGQSESTGNDNILIGDVVLANNADSVTLIGHNSYAAVPGECSLGNQNRPHVSCIPVRAPAGAASGAGTYSLEAFGTSTSGPLLGLLLSTTPPVGEGVCLRVQGTVIARVVGDPTYLRVWDVDYVISGVTLVYSALTVLHTGGAGVMSLSVDGGGDLAITTGGAYPGLIVRGLLRTTKNI